MKGSHRKCEEAPKKYDENRRASSSFGMLNGANAAYGKGIWKAPPLKRFKGGTVILCGDKGMDAPHLVRLCGALCGGCTFRDYFVAALLVPPSAGRTDNEGHSLRSVCTFRGYFAPWGLVPLLRNGANRHPRIAVRSPLLCRSDVVLVRPKYKEKRDAKTHLIFLGALSGTTSPLWGSCRRKRRGEPTSENSGSFSLFCRSDVVLLRSKYKEKKRYKNASLFSWCTFRDSNPGPID